MKFLIVEHSLLPILIPLGHKYSQILTGKGLLGRSTCRWKDNIRMDLKGIGINTRNWADSIQERDYWKALVNAALNLRVP
jgi:hypothetical protein